MSDEQWEAEITQGGRWTWYITYRRDVSMVNPAWRGMAFGSRRHAEAKARRALAILRRDDERIAASWTVS